MKEQENIDFVARHYRRGAFSARAALMKMGLARSRRRNPWAVAASIIVAVAITASAAFFIHREFSLTNQTVNVEETEMTTPQVVKVLDFEAAALPTVISEIENAYDVKIGGAPADAASLQLTLHYEGDIGSLISTINDILGTGLYIEQ